MRPALRLAWREIVRYKGRSLLVLALIGLPILASVSAVTVIETSEITGVEARSSTYGSARALVTFSGDEAGITTDPRQIDSLTATQARQRLTAATDLPAVPADWSAHWLAAPGANGWSVDVLQTDLGSPLAAGLVQVVSGRLPRTAGEIAVSPHLAHDGAAVGTMLSSGGQQLHVVGVARSFYDRTVQNDAAVVTTATSLPASSGTASSPVSWTFLVGSADDAPLDTATLDRLEHNGFTVTDRTATGWDWNNSLSGTDVSLITLLITCLLIEIVLLAGPAFAVGVRRQRRTLALLAVAGGTPQHIRRTVLAQGLILGLTASVLGAALSIPLTWAGLSLVERLWGLTAGPFDIGWIAVGPAIVLGTLSAVLASVVPARLAARADVVTALSDRQPAPRVKAGWPILGAVVLFVGTMGSINSLSASTGDLVNAWWAVVSVCGAVMMTPWLIATIARIAPRLGLALRISLRDADRHRSRSAPAIAAVMASVSAVVALGIASASDDRQNSRDYTAGYPLGTVTLSVFESAQVAPVVAAVKQQTGITLTRLQRVGSAGLDPDSSMIDNPAISQYATAVVVADDATLRAWGVHLSEAARSALQAGRALVDRESAAHDGPVEFSDWSDEGESRLSVDATVADLRMAGTVPDGAPRPVVAGLVIPPATAARLHLGAGSDEVAVLIADGRAAAAGQIEAIAQSLTSGNAAVEVAEQQQSYYWLLFALLGALGAFTVLLGTFTATGLALDDARNDLDTLSAVGARPRTRRAVAGAHAFLIAFVGAVLGVVVGFTPGITASRLLTINGGTGWILVIPWPLLGAVVIGLPLLAGLLTAAVTRTRSTVLRREA
ncbi:FtsX-like permease family protein [Nocardioides sp.]|uniref:FtsX-like permease family protein n=1 Tax=Nocardioides sp. TaxID=35761 RepID=UPI0026228912|nr:FtsX-like permease family protein [Nocardioides sp.]